MIAFLRFRFRYGAYLRNEHGIKKFAEMSLGQLIRKVTKKSATYREMNENLLVEKANLRIQRDEHYERPTLEAAGFFSARRRLWANTTLVGVTLTAAAFLNALSINTFITNAAMPGATFRWIVSVLTAIVLTGSGLIITERLIDVFLGLADPNDAFPSKNRFARAALWGVLLGGIELSILGLAEAYAPSLAGQNMLLYLSFIIAMLLLPLIAGAFHWDSTRFIDRYKATLVLRQIESRLAQIDSIIHQNEEYESNFYRMKSIEYWDWVNDFKTYKDNLNQKKDIVEHFGGHFAQSYDLFQAEANKRYTQDIRDITAQSLRKLALVDAGHAGVGQKIGQAAEATRAERPAENKSTPARPAPRTPIGLGTEEYLPLKPLR